MNRGHATRSAAARPWSDDDVQALRRGDDAILDRLYREHVRTVHSWVVRLGGPQLDADDVTQDAFAVAFRCCRSFRGESAVTTWLYGITRRVVANARRRAAFRRFFGLSSDPVDPSDGPGEQLDRLRERRLVQLALEELPLRKREVVVLVELEGRPAPEVAEMLGVPVGTIYSRLHHARQALGDALRRHGVDRRQA